MQPTTYIPTFSHSLLSWTLGSNLPTPLPIVHHHNSFPASQPASSSVSPPMRLERYHLETNPIVSIPSFSAATKFRRWPSISNKMTRNCAGHWLSLSARLDQRSLALLYVVDLGYPPSNQFGHPADRPDILWSDVCMHAY